MKCVTHHSIMLLRNCSLVDSCLQCCLIKQSLCVPVLAIMHMETGYRSHYFVHICIYRLGHADGRLLKRFQGVVLGGLALELQPYLCTKLMLEGFVHVFILFGGW